MAAASLRGDGLPSRAPPPTPIATAKGSRSAAVDDRVLAEYLERSLRVPRLTLPDRHPSPPHGRPRIPAAINLRSISSGDEASRGRLLASAAGVGAVRIDGHGVSEGEVRAAMEAAEGVFRVAGDGRGALGRYFRRRGGAREEFLWFRPASPAEEAALLRVCPGSYSTFRERLENMCTKLERIAESIGEILSVSMEFPHNEARAEKIPPAVLCSRKYSFHHFGNPSSSVNAGEEAAMASPPHALSLHLLGDNREFVILSEEGSVPFPVPSGSIVVTLNKDYFQEMRNDEFKGVDGEPIFELSSALGPSFSLEYMCSPTSLFHRSEHSMKTVSLLDQLLTALVLTLLHKLWVWIFA
uniref:Beta-amylase 1, chloroplastic n=1 Tax=Anthurium amnicola TaxID=1678845 RepID=A0A1D1ZDD0_9ARAE